MSLSMAGVFLFYTGLLLVDRKRSRKDNVLLVSVVAVFAVVLGAVDLFVPAYLREGVMAAAVLGILLLGCAALVLVTAFGPNPSRHKATKDARSAK